MSNLYVVSEVEWARGALSGAPPEVMILNIQYGTLEVKTYDFSIFS
jgi:hypothetical protein